jgi:four helix bundle protein
LQVPIANLIEQQTAWPISKCQLSIQGERGERMTPEEMRDRTRQFAIRILRLADSLPKSASGRTISSQIAKSGSSVAANYRAACKARSRKEFISKLGVAEEEADETQLWLELIESAGLMNAERLSPLQQEAKELTAIIAASRISASRNQQPPAAQ